MGVQVSSLLFTLFYSIWYQLVLLLLYVYPSYYIYTYIDYVAEMKRGVLGAFSPIYVGPENHCIINSLVDSDYTFRVRAENAVGEGPNSEEIFVYI